MNDKPAHYTDEDHAKIGKIQAWLDSGHTGAELSRMTAVKEGTRSSILSGSYISSPSKFLDRMLDAIGRQQERETAGKSDIPFTLTSVANTIYNVCRRTHSDRDFGFYAGRVGIGKTTACRQYVKDTPSAVLIEAFEGIDHSTFMAELIGATGATITHGTVSMQMANLIKALKGTDKLVIVDEANWLPKRSFGALRRLSDVAEIGVVLVGTADLLPMVQDPDGRFGQISSRIGYWPQVARQISLKDAEMMVSNFMADGGTVNEGILKAFYESCEGSARTLRNLLRNSYRASKKNGAEVTPDLIRKINQQTMAGRSFQVGAL